MQWDPFQCKFVDSCPGGGTSLLAFYLQQNTISVTADTAVYPEKCYSDCDPKHARNLCQSHIYQRLNPPPRGRTVLFSGICHVSAGGNSDAPLREKKLASAEAGLPAPELRTGAHPARPEEPLRSGPRDKNCTPLPRNGSGCFHSSQISDQQDENR